MEATNSEVDDDPVEDHHDGADQCEKCGPETFVSHLHPSVDQQDEDEEGVESEGFFWIPAPWTTP